MNCALDGKSTFVIGFNSKVESMGSVKGGSARLLKEITLMKDILLNPASHSNHSIPIHKSECEYAYGLLVNKQMLAASPVLPV